MYDKKNNISKTLPIVILRLPLYMLYDIDSNFIKYLPADVVIIEYKTTKHRPTT